MDAEQIELLRESEDVLSEHENVLSLMLNDEATTVEELKSAVRLVRMWRAVVDAMRRPSLPRDPIDRDAAKNVIPFPVIHRVH